MKTKGKNEYPLNWGEISKQIKEKNNCQCERCYHINDPENGYTLTVHHLDGNKANNEEWNLAALCQRCHLNIQNRVFLPQIFMFDHSPWFLSHVAGYYESEAGKALYRALEIEELKNENTRSI